MGRHQEHGHGTVSQNVLSFAAKDRSQQPAASMGAADNEICGPAFRLLRNGFTEGSLGRLDELSIDRNACLGHISLREVKQTAPIVSDLCEHHLEFLASEARASERRAVDYVDEADVGSFRACDLERLVKSPARLCAPIHWHENAFIHLMDLRSSR